MLGDRITYPVFGRRIGRAYLRRHRGRPTCLAYRDQGGEGQAGRTCFTRPFFEETKRRRLRLECAACFQEFIIKGDGSAYPVQNLLKIRLSAPLPFYVVFFCLTPPALPYHGGLQHVLWSAVVYA